MKRVIASGIVALTLLAASMWAGVATQSTSAYNDTGTYLAHWTVSTSATTTFNWSGYLSGWTGGGGVALERNGVGVLSEWLTVGLYRSGSLSGQAAGSFKVTHGFGGPPGAVYGSINSSLTW